LKTLKWLVRIAFLALFVFLVLNGRMVVWLAIFAVSLLAAIGMGRVYCGYVCPMNTLMIPVEKISKKMNFQTDKVPAFLSGGKLPWIFLAVSMMAMLGGKRLLGIEFPVLFLWLVLAAFITLHWPAHVFHNLICPFGALQKVFGAKAHLSHRVSEQACIGCRRCEKACSSAAIAVGKTDKKAHINTALCHQCNSCAEVCPENAIHYK
jgi:polyferredoxin